ncbi:MAG: hypothetical protein IJ668_08595 [Selenomonadaceae bacterium]|nr:hypothetical protein [Selenomonadaceae bacterium]
MANYHTGVISGQEAVKLYSYPTLPAEGTTDTSLFLAGNGTFTVPFVHPTVTAAAGQPTVDQAPGFGGYFTVSQVSRDSLGHVADISNWNITIPSAEATTVQAGLMSAADKIAVNNASSYEARIASLEALLSESLSVSVNGDGGLVFSRSNGTNAITVDYAGYY